MSEHLDLIKKVLYESEVWTLDPKDGKYYKSDTDEEEEGKYVAHILTKSGFLDFIMWWLIAEPAGDDDFSFKEDKGTLSKRLPQGMKVLFWGDDHIKFTFGKETFTFKLIKRNISAQSKNLGFEVREVRSKALIAIWSGKVQPVAPPGAY